MSELPEAALPTTLPPPPILSSEYIISGNRSNIRKGKGGRKRRQKRGGSGNGNCSNNKPYDIKTGGYPRSARAAAKIDSERISASGWFYEPFIIDGEEEERSPKMNLKLRSSATTPL